jgi:hypothetical protein
MIGRFSTLAGSQCGVSRLDAGGGPHDRWGDQPKPSWTCGRTSLARTKVEVGPSWSSQTSIGGPQSVRTFFSGIQCPGCERSFTPTRPNQRHCQAACRKRAERKMEAARIGALLARLDPYDPGRPE